ncbi:MAG TPA: SIS domain-containing protein [Planctomycetota bacterium]|nr:SIS domain-containing protein [Planctomycetota bacterium]
MKLDLPQCQACGSREAAYHVIEMNSASVEFRCCSECWKKIKASLRGNGDPYEQLVAGLHRLAPNALDADTKVIREHLIETISAKIRMATSLELVEKIREIADVLITCLRREGTIFTCGAGASADQASHLVQQLIGRYKSGARRGFPAVCLGTSPALLDDFSFEDVFVRQVEALVTEHDVLIGISSNGNSAAVVRGLRRAAEQGAFTIGMCGGDGGAMLDATRLSLVVPSNQNQTIQECQAAAVHILCELIERALCNDSDSSDPVLV